MRKLFAGITIAMMFLLPMIANSQNQWVTIDDITYTIRSENDAVVFDASSCSGNVIIRNTVSYTISDIPHNATVRSIDENAFLNSAISSVTIPSGITYIGKSAFERCSDLASITIPNSVTTIESYAFYGCDAITSVKVEWPTPIEINSTTFSNRTNATLYVPQGCKSAYQSATYWNEFKEIIEYAPSSSYILSIKAIGYGSALYNGVTIRNKTTSFTVNGGTDVTISFTPDNGYKIKHVKVNGNIVSLSDDKNTITTNFGIGFGGVDDGTHEPCSRLDEDIIENTTVEVEFEALPITTYSLNITSSSGGYVTYFGNTINGTTKSYAVNSGASATLTFTPNSGYRLKSVTVNGSDVTASVVNNQYTISNISKNTTVVATFEQNSLKDGDTFTAKTSEGIDMTFKVISASEKTCQVGDGSYTSINMSTNRTITIPSNANGFTVSSIGGSAFSRCSSLTSVTIPNSVTSIGGSAFSGCSSLTSVTIPNSVTSIVNSAFSGCSGLSSIIVSSGNTKYDSRNNCNAIIEKSSNSLIVGCKNTVIPNSVTSIGDYAFQNCTSLTSITIPNSVTSIRYSAFYGCSGLTSITIPNSVTSIGYSAFYGCSGLTSITIPNSVTSIGNNAFFYCSGLTSITIPNSVTSIGEAAFEYCSGLSSIIVSSGNTKYDSRNNCNAIIEKSTNTLILGCKNTVIPNSVTSIGYSAFEGCSGLTSITIPNSVTSIGEGAFYGCSSLTSITIPNSVTSIGDYAFYYCSGLTSITIPNSVTSIGSNAFKGCSGLTSVTIPNSVTSIGNYAFYNCSNLKDVISEIKIPFVINENVFSSNTYSTAKLTVPAGTKSAYQSTNYWNKFLNIVEYGTPTTYSLSITVSSGGSVTYLNNTISGTTKSFNVDESTSVTLTFTPDNGCRLGSVIVNGTDVTSRVTNNQYTISNISQNTTVSVDFVKSSSIITFADANVKAICVANWDTNGDGELSVAEAAAVTSLGEVFQNNAIIKSFDELRFFTNLKSIGEKSFFDCSSLTSVTIPNSVMTIRINAFSRCVNLTSIFIPNSVTDIGYYAFSGCSSLTSVTIPNNVTNIGEGAFSVCSGLTSITIGNSVMNIGNSAFYGCSGVTSITIGNSVTSIGKYAFQNCSGLTSVIISDIAAWCKISFDGYTSNPLSCAHHLYLNGVEIKDLVIPNSVTSIGVLAFYGCSGLTSVSIPSSVTSIGGSAFYGCTGLTSITIPKSVTSIGGYAFQNCTGLTSIKVESGNTKYDSRDNCNAIIEKSSNSLIVGCKNTVIPNSVTSIGNDAFWGCSGLTSITIPNSVTSIGNYAFQNCSGLTSVTIGNSVTSIGNYAFEGCSGLTSVAIGNSVTSIGSWAFSGCSGLTSITIPNSVTSIGNYAFQNCSGLTSVIISDIAAWCKISFDGYTSNPLSCAHHLYLNGVEIKDLVIPNSVTSIGNYAFQNCRGLTSVAIGNSVTSIGGGAFSVCSGLTSVSIPSSVTSIGNSAFQNCSGLTSVIISDIAAWCKITFDGYTSNPLSCAHHLYLNGVEIKDLVIPNSVTSIGVFAFYGCSGLTSVSIPSSVTSIGGQAFYGCSGLTSVSIPSSVTSIGGQAFYGCSGLTSVSIPSSVTSIGWSAFYGCNGLKDVISEIKKPFVISENVFSVYSTAQLTVPAGTKSAYQSTAGWNKFSNIVEDVSSTTYSLSVIVSSGGSVTYLGNTISGATKSFNVDEGTSATMTFTPNDGYRLRSLIVNGTEVTSSVTNNQYTISNITQNTTVDVTFEEVLTNFSLTITQSGGGYVSYSIYSVSGTTQSKNVYDETTETIEEGSTIILSFIPNSGYRIKDVKVNNLDVTSSLSNNEYVIDYINQNTTIEVTFEEIITYSLTITATGNGYVYYGNESVRNYTSTYTVAEGISATITINPDYGYRLKSVKVNGTDVTSSVNYNLYTISNINQNTTVDVIFEEIPLTTYSLTITATGNGYVYYGNESVRNYTSTYTVAEGISATITINPDYGYRLKSVKVNGTDVTSSVNYNLYTISNINQNTTVDVIFEEIPPTTYSLTITATGNGYVYYGNESVRNYTSTYTVTEGTSATITINPDYGYQLKSVKVDGADVSSSVSNNEYVISNINKNTTVEVTFEVVPTTYWLTIIATGNGYASYDGINVRNGNYVFSVIEGVSATIRFVPDDGYRIKGVLVNDADVMSNVTDSQYTISNINGNTTVEVEFVEKLKNMTVDGVNYKVASYGDQTVKIETGSYGPVLTAPASFEYMEKTWTVIGIENNALANSPTLTAIRWEPDYAMTATVGNPNLLLYVKSATYAPSAIKNVVVNGVANSITLTEAANGNDFYCPESFTAKAISFTHKYTMTTGIDDCQGWESIALPFDVQTITHAEKGTIVPFATWHSGDAYRPFWLYEMTSNGWKAAQAIRSNTPYIISMPYNSLYYSEACLNGIVTFSAENVTVDKTEANIVYYNGKRFVPNFMNQSANGGVYALNVSNDWESNNTYMKPGSEFVRNMRSVHPFEAYMTTTNDSRMSYGVFEDMPTEIRGVIDQLRNAGIVNVYNLNGQKIKVEDGAATVEDVKRSLSPGVYIIDGRKTIIKK